MFSWIKSLTSSLLSFWAKNPKATLPIVKFIFKKIIYSPKFLKRNVMIESEQNFFENKLKKIQNVYKDYSKDFNPREKMSYDRLKSKLDEKEQILYFLVRKLKPKIVVETGVAAGNSSGYILQGLHDNGSGKLYSVDLPFQWYVYGKNHELHLDSLPTGNVSGYLVPKTLRRKWNLIIGNTYDKLPKLIKSLGKIDIFLHDSEHTYKTMMFEYKTAWLHIKDSGVLLSDDIHFTQAFEDFSNNLKLKHSNFRDLGILFKTKGT